MHLFCIMSTVSILLHMIKSDLLLRKADIRRKLSVGDPLVSDKLSPSLTHRINGVMSKRSMIVTLTLLESISISEFIDALPSYSSTFQADMSASFDLGTSRLHASLIFHPKIHPGNGITVTIQQNNNPDAVAVQNARCAEKWCGQGNQLDNVLIQEIEHHETIVRYVMNDISLPNCYPLFDCAKESIQGKTVLMGV